jgi:hypothetical protein
VIGLNAGYIPNYGYINFNSPCVSSGTSSGSNSTITEKLSSDPSYVPTCIGVYSTSDNGAGRLVTGMKFENGDNNRPIMVTQAKDHGGLTGGWLYTYSSQIKKQ